jgi:rSAM/selenodomain-associated transferase 2
MMPRSDRLRISVIVPTLDEAPFLRAALDGLAPLRARGHELIIVDGGSTDGTLEIAPGKADHVIGAPRGRAIQMNAGARIATGDVLVFVHADTRLPVDADLTIARELERSGGLWGRFDVSIDGSSPLLGLVARAMNARSRLSGIATGDQAIFVRRAEFAAVGGFPALALMEDVAMSRRLKRRSPPICLRERAITSGRRWEANGVLRTIAHMWWLRLQYFLGASPDRLARSYDERD